jgi:hypothetical protein
MPDGELGPTHRSQRTSVYQFALVAIKNPIFSTSCVTAIAAPAFGTYFALSLIEEWRRPQKKL